MTNQLLKLTNASYVAGSPGVAADPGYPARSAYTSWNWQTVCKYRDVTYTWTQDADGTWRYVPLYTGVVGPYECTRQLVPTYYPYDPGRAPTPAVPAGPYQVFYDLNLGWNAGANSVRFFDRHGVVRFTVNPSTIGSVTGLARESARPGVYQDIEHGIYISHGVARIYEKGVEVAYAGAVADGAELSISRINNVVRYAIGASVVHQSSTPSTGRVFMTAALYAGGDYVDSPIVTNAILFAAMESKGKENTTTETSPYTRGLIEQLFLTDECAGILPSKGSMTFLPLSASGGMTGYVSGAVASFEEMTVQATESGDLVPSYAIASMAFVPLTVSAVGSSQFSTPKYTATVERDYITGAITVIVAGIEGSTVTITFPSGETRTGTITDGLLTFVSSPSQPTTGSIVITTTLPDGSIITQTITFNANGSITVSGTGAEPGAGIGGSFQSGSTSTTAAADGTYTMTSTTNQPLGAFSVFVTVGGYASFRPLQAFGGSPAGTSYAQAIASFLPLTVSASGLEGNTQASMRETIVPSSTATYLAFFDVSISFGATSGTTMATVVLLDGEMADGATAGSTMTRNAIMQALIENDVQVFAGIPIYSEDGECWVINDETGSAAMYEDYGFNSYAVIDGRYYGAKADGLYLLEGDDDAGQPVRASVSFGKHDFGTTEKKTLPNVYIGVSSSGHLWLKITANGEETLYRTVASNTYTATQRIKPAKGIRATHMTFELFNDNGADFDIASIEFEPAILSRRV